MGNRTKLPMEQPKTRALVNAILDYLENTHGAFILIAVKDWVKEKDNRLQGLRTEQDKFSDKKDIQG